MDDYQDDQYKVSCPVCRTDAFLNPRIVFLLSPCYHRLCTGCVGRLFQHGSAPCPVCGTTLRRSAFVEPVFGDARVEKEVRMRRLVLASVGERKREDFAGGPEYEDYLEQIEDWVQGLTDDVDADRIQRRLDEIRRSRRLEEYSNISTATSTTTTTAATTTTTTTMPATSTTLSIEEELQQERKKRRLERRADIDALAAGRPRPQHRLVPLDTVPNTRSLLPLNHPITTVLVGPQAEAGGLLNSVVLQLLFQSVNFLLNVE